MIYLGADHRGYRLKSVINEYLSKHKIEFEDLGSHSEEAVDFPHFAKAVGEVVAKDPRSKGILLCGNGQGICIAANKIRGVRAGTAWNKELAASIRQHDDANIMCLPADFLSAGDVADVVEAFLNTPFEAVDRRIRRKQQIEALENDGN